MSAPQRSPVPPWLRGLWRRRSIVYPDGRRDDTTLVYWLQTASAFADIRIPAARPDLRAHADLAQLDATARRALAEQGGFAGWTALDGDRCQWQRVIDYQPFSGVPDEGRLRREDDLVIEEGIHTPYVEVWQRQACGDGPIMALDLPSSAGRRQMLVVCGDRCIYARDRARRLPAASSLAALLDQPTALPEAVTDLFDCELSFARRDGDAWRVELSTIPSREGATLVVPAASNSAD